MSRGEMGKAPHPRKGWGKSKSFWRATLDTLCQMWHYEDMTTAKEATEMTTTSDILTALNGYTGDNIWQDVILALPTYEYVDEDYELRQQQTSDFFTAGGVEYRYDEQQHQWVA